ncbi:hypothetical protein [Polaromonas sp. CG_9.11]|uniref:hypothetical protein n=1 Tax=Polaromonas sp. CG_9.11 TaxID=2787730 RepID=UPI0018C9248D|nr:hypothetical protein [Polaromonas sp. CG_9.11]MBG6077858.1 hypothetical protein [Polaromonas sp. CG_9.11]
MNELLAPIPGIDARLVSVLILVDGFRDSDDVNRLAKAVDLPVDGLDILFHGGFIDRKFKGSAAPAEGKMPTSAEPVAPVNATPARKLERFNALYAHLVEKTKALLGLRGFIYQLRIERASTLLELKALTEPIGMAIEKRHGVEIAKDFMRESERLAVAAIAERDI